MNDSLARHVIVLALLCIAVTAAAYVVAGTRATLCCAALALVAIAFFLVISLHRRAEMRRLTAEIDEVLNMGRRLSFSDCREGDVAVLANELEKMVARLARLTSQLEDEKGALADALADISHQIRTPLTAVELMLPAIERADDPEQRKQLVRELEHLLERVSWLVATLLKMAKVDAGALRMESRPVSVDAMVSRACGPLELPLDLRGIALAREIPEGLGFKGDETWCAEALENIVKNSMEHCATGGTITIRATEDALACRIFVSDDGPGISDEDLPHLFERFYRGVGSKHGEGFGVGLALARSLITGQGGSLRAANLSGEDGAPAGALFEMAFPKLCV
ncbi:MAG: HAMP domain-containing sensor histidine kinase [Coriobacteriales bacterium]